MARRAVSRAPWTVYPERGTAFINTTVVGRRIRQSLGVPLDESRRAEDLRAAEAAASARYAELVAGRVLDNRNTPRIQTAHTLHELAVGWLEESEKLYPSSVSARVIYARHFEDWSNGDLEKLVTDTGPEQYAITRLTSVLRTTVRKELTGLFAFLDWMRRNGHLADIPPHPKLPKGMAGKRSGPQREESVPISPKEAEAIIAALPEEVVSPRGTFVVRDLYVLAYQTGLRPGLFARLETPKHWRKGQTFLHITKDIDKSRYDRDVPLSDQALAVLTRQVKKPGLVFGKHDYRNVVKKAAASVLPQDRAVNFSTYDFRHARTTHSVAQTGNLPGVAFMVGHKQITTTNHYVHANEDHAREVVSKLSADSCEGGDLNPYANYGASTSKERDSGILGKTASSSRQQASANAEETTPRARLSSAGCQQVPAVIHGVLETFWFLWPDVP